MSCTIRFGHLLWLSEMHWRLSKLHANISLGDLQLHQTRQFADILRSKFGTVSFEGASGFVKFNLDKEESSVVEIYQVVNGAEEILGVYNPDANDSLQLQRKTSQPPDRFQTKTVLLPIWVSTLFNIVILIFIAVTTSVLIFVVVLKDRPEMKALSPSLSLAMIAGCYLIFVSTLMRNIRQGYPVTNFHAYTTLCNMQLWLWMIGLTLIFSAMLLRLFRINHIFKAYGKVSSYWKDKYMIMCILTICFGGVLILATWTYVDKIKMVTEIEYQPIATPPFFKSKSVCSCDTLGIWLALTLSYNGILMMLNVFLAVQTRKIKLSNFKNTKQINIFIVLTCMTLSIMVPLWYVMDALYGYNILGHFIICFAFSCTGVYCLIFVFLPRVFVTVKNIRADKTRKNIIVSRTNTLRERESQFSVYRP